MQNSLAGRKKQNAANDGCVQRSASISIVTGGGYEAVVFVTAPSLDSSGRDGRVEDSPDEHQEDPTTMRGKIRASEEVFFRGSLSREPFRLAPVKDRYCDTYRYTLYPIYHIYIPCIPIYTQDIPYV